MTQHLTRRRFLGNSAGAAAGAFAAPLFVPNLYGQESPNDKLNVASIGVGGRGTGIGKQASQIGHTVACCDVHRGNAERFAKQVGGDIKIYTDYRELLAQEESVDAVTIGTPDHWHVKIAIDAMRAGKHVYCEKPLTLTIEEGALIKQAVDKYDKVFQVGTQQRSEYRLNFLKAVAIAQSGRLGQNLEAVSSVGKSASRSPDKNKPFGPFDSKPVPPVLDWNLWQGQTGDVEFCDQRVGWNFRWWFEYSGGQVTDWGVHHTDIAFWALAGQEGLATEAHGSGEFMGVEREQVRDFLLGKIAPSDMPHAFNVAHSFDVDVKLSTGNTIKILSGPNELLISGENGKIRVNRGSLVGKPVEEVDRDPKAKAEIEELMAKLYGGELPRENLGHMNNFFDCIKNGRTPVANVHDHVRAVNACHLANIALLTDRKVKFDPAKNEFPGDPEATQLTTRQRRKEFEITV